MRVEQEQKLTEDARRFAEQDATAQRYAAQVLQVIYLFNVFAKQRCTISTLCPVLGEVVHSESAYAWWYFISYFRLDFITGSVMFHMFFIEESSYTLQRTYFFP